MSSQNDLTVRGGQILPVHQVPQTQLLSFLNAADVCTERRVMEEEPAPGPFGAATHAYNIKTGENHIIGDIDSNRVNRDGPTAHAEAVNLYPNRIPSVEEFLEGIKKDQDWVLLFVSTGESCPSCNTKQQIYVGDWIRRGLITRDRVMNVFGADYDMTQETAGFSDKIQLEDMQKFPNGGGKADFLEGGILNYPQDVRDFLEGSNLPASVVLENGEIVSVGYDERKDSDLISTPEVSAIRKASRLKEERRLGEAWNLSNMILISPTSMADAPLARSTAFWASIARMHTVRSDIFVGRETKESSYLTNEALYKAVTNRDFGSYGPSSLIHILQVREDSLGNKFENLAQKAWPVRVARDAEKGRNIHYDGGQDHDGGKNQTAPKCDC
jgi:tRNA(Arg) A34 adenosine deaminase TadA